jgi:hypothetical protein
MKIIRKLVVLSLITIGLLFTTLQTTYAFSVPQPNLNYVAEVDAHTIEEYDGVLTVNFYYSNTLYTVDISKFQYYSVIDTDLGNTRYFIADVLEFRQSNSNIDIAKIIIYTSNQHTVDLGDLYIDIVVYIHQYHELVRITDEISYELAQELIVNSTDWIYGDDEISERLISSINIIENYSNATTNMTPSIVSFGAPGFWFEDGGEGGGGSSTPTIPNNIKANAQNTVNLYQYDTYTNTDLFIDTYTVPNNSWRTSDNKITDDDITKIIPKSLFFTAGIYTYVGQEYGFFVNTIKQQNYLYVVEVFVFDIEVIKPGMIVPIAEGKAKVIPLFQYKYYAREKGTMSSSDWNSSYSSSLTSVVYPHLSYDSPNYYLKNVAFRFTVDNFVTKNFGETGYNPNSDTGDFILQTRYNFSGEGKKTGRNSFVLDTALTAFGFVPGWGDALSLLQYGVEVYNNVSQGTYKENRQGVIFDNEINITTNYQYREDQILYYGNLLKSARILPKNQSDDFSNPLLIGTRIPNNYVQGIVLLTNEGGLSASQESRFYVSISLDVAFDGTSYLIWDWFPSGSVNTVDSSGSVYNYGNYKRGTQALNEHQIVANTVTKNGETKYFKFVPNRSGTYTFETSGGSNTYLTIFDIYGNIISTDDDSGDGFNAKVTQYLNRNNTYYIQAKMRYSSHTGSFNLKVGYATTGVLQLNTQVNFLLVNQFNVYQFSVGISKDYVIQTLGTVNTLITIYDINGNIIAQNDNWYDSNGVYNLNARCLVSLNSGQTYFIKVSHSSAVNIIPYNVILLASPAY